ncbi:SAM-dependent methyltransferase [Endozoicomonas montiporae]|uniref:Release factor glutamine methyltransferase n=2 Tax=Endozoicomonas montiporae TaxID=1027273 RepID=A0A081N4I0_9GAMM|nr:peptide chain release factor N(5)-glutamine methyltransferase [Endozoicomonas montiporae]AMO57790.1 HemK family modification methylase [Endozoicomonas montiporae CL-33]KEQ13353.1 SAM-dependent methyltransferase [Endozoicomonas montiporae]
MSDYRIDHLLKQTTEQLKDSATARLDVEILLCHVLGKDRSFLFTWPEYELNEQQLSDFRRLVTERIKGTPVAYLTGARDFWTLKLSVSPATLIPRPDTELLVEQALAKPLPDNARVADLGTGTGAIALALASEKQRWAVTGVDKFEDAVTLAERNALKNRITNAVFSQGSWCASLPGDHFHMIVSNPPYICSDDEHLSQGDVRFEPETALASGADGLDDIRIIIQQATTKLVNGGWLLLEHGYHQAESIRQLMGNAGFDKISTVQDLSGHDRVTQGQLSN